MSLIQKGLKAAKGFLGGIQTYLIVGAVSIAVGAAGGAYAGYRWQEGKVANLKLTHIAEQKAAVEAAASKQKQDDDIVLAAAILRAKNQAYLAGVRAGMNQEIANHVSDNSNCITYGLVRVFNTAAFGTSVSELSLAPGKPDDACAPVSWRSFAADITDDYAIGRDNASQLNDLINTVKALHDTPRGPQQ